jgi:hypothetical protein
MLICRFNEERRNPPKIIPHFELKLIECGCPEVLVVDGERVGMRIPKPEPTAVGWLPIDDAAYAFAAGHGVILLRK